MRGKAKKRRRIAPGLARVRKEIPPPGVIIESKKIKSRKRTKEELRQELKESMRRHSS